MSATITEATGKPMGRPPLNHTRIPVRLPQEDIDRMDALVGTYGRGKFIREAVRRELERQEKAR